MHRVALKRVFHSLCVNLTKQRFGELNRVYFVPSLSIHRRFSEAKQVIKQEVDLSEEVYTKLVAYTEKNDAPSVLVTIEVETTFW